MALKGLRKRLPVLGKIKIGQAMPKGTAPMKFDHIELTTVARNAEGQLTLDVAATRRALMQRPGGDPVPTCGGCARSSEAAKRYKVPEFEKGLPLAIDVLLPYNDLALAFPHEMAYFHGGTLWCHGDREVAMRRPQIGTRKFKKKQGGQTTEVEVPVYGDAVEHRPCGAACEFYMQPKRCKAHGRLFLILAADPSIGGCYEFYTTSINSIENLVNGIENLAAWSGGLIQWIPMRFQVNPQSLTVKDQGIRTTQMIASIEFAGSPLDFQRIVAEQMRERAPLMAEIRQLEARIKGESPDPLTVEEITHVEREFDVGAHPGETIDIPNLDNFPGGAPSPAPVPAATPEVPDAAGGIAGAEHALPDTAPDGEDETYGDVPSDGEAPPAEAVVPPVRDPASDPGRPKIAKARITMLRQAAKVRAKEGGIEDEDGGSTLLNLLLASRGIGSVEDVREDEFAAVLSAVKTASV